MNERSLPNGWVWTTLQGVCSPSQYGWTTKASSHGTLRLLRTTDITTDSLNWTTVPFCSEEPPDKKKYLLKTGDIVISRAGSVGCSYLIKNPPKAVFASYLIRFRPLPIIDENYLSFFLKSSFYWNTILAEKTGSTLPNVNATKLKRVPVPFPPFPEQRTIVHILQTIQEAKATRQREIELERERKAALMDYLFSHGTKGELRKETEIGEVPESWEVVKLGKVADITYGVQAAIAHLLDESVGLPILTNINITLDGTFDLSTLRYYELPQNKRGKLILKKGDILFNWRSGSQHHVGKTVLFDLDGEHTFSSFILRFRFDKKVKHAFAFHYFHYLRQKGFFALKRSQSSVNSVFNASRSAKIPVVLPAIEEQSKISNALQACDTKIAALKREAQHIDELFHAMLDELMTGQRSAMPLIDTEMDV